MIGEVDAIYMIDENDKKMKTMQLYNDIDRIWNELENQGISRLSESIVQVNIVNQYDCYNYAGSTSIIETGRRLKLSSHTKVVDIGSGIGGPGRCLFSNFNCKLLGIELHHQHHQHHHQPHHHHCRH